MSSTIHLQMTTLRLQGNALARQGEFEEAIQTYDEALQLKVPDGRHLVLSNKAGVLLQLGKAKAALKSAEEAALSCPPDFHNATFRQVRLLYNRLQDASEPTLDDEVCISSACVVILGNPVPDTEPFVRNATTEPCNLSDDDLPSRRHRNVVNGKS